MGGTLHGGMGVGWLAMMKDTVIALVFLTVFFRDFRVWIHTRKQEVYQLWSPPGGHLPSQKLTYGPVN